MRCPMPMPRSPEKLVELFDGKKVVDLPTINRGTMIDLPIATEF